MSLSAAGQQALAGGDAGGGWFGAGVGALGRLGDGLLSFLGKGLGFGGGDVIDSLQKSLLQPVHDAVAQLAEQAGRGSTGAVVGHATLSVEGISLTISQSKNGIDVSFDEVSIHGEADVAAAAKDGSFAAYAGFAAEVSSLHVSLHIGAAGASTGAASGPADAAQAVQGGGAADGVDPASVVVVNALPPGDPRRLGPDGTPRTDAIYIPDLSGITAGLRQLQSFLRAVAADATGAAGVPFNRNGPAAPTLLVLRDHHRDDAGNTHLLLDAHQPFAVPGAVADQPAAAVDGGAGVNIQA
ncbi:MAG: hypothetical protein HYR63_06330 [Proteobacteria bacterium]|nr:hypothetical protein [Pseudomonadota bacterium]MBI3495953.1 hypothetical protein [Pseudomonadota bacterium]